MRAAAIITAILGFIFLVLAAAQAGGMASVHDGAWLGWGGLACLALSWIFTLIPA